MQVRVYLVGWMKAIAGALTKRSLELHDTLPENAVPDPEGESEDRDTWPEAGLASSAGLPLAELRIDLSGSAAEMDDHAHRIVAAIEREVRDLSAEYRVEVVPHAKS
jgi:hypothetical protein